MHSALAPIILVAAQLMQGAPPSTEEDYRVAIGTTGAKIFLRHQPAATHGARTIATPVLILHGSTLPSALSSAARIGGVSWMDDLARRGFDVWAMDFLGFGGADRYPDMAADPATQAPAGRAADVVPQVDAAVTFIQQHTKSKQIGLIAHSWGTIPGAMYAIRSPEAVAALVLFGPVVTRTGARDTTSIGAWYAIAPEARLAGLAGLPPKGAPRVLEDDYAASFRKRYLESDPTSASRTPPSVALPSGADADLRDMWSGTELYDASRITAPVLIVRGEWDEITTDADARRLFDSLKNTTRRDVKLSNGTHVMQLERARSELYASVAAFLGDHLSR